MIHTGDLLLRGGAAAAGFCYGMLNGQGRSAVLLAALMVADYISGIVAAALGQSPNSAHGKLDSEAGARGLLKKGMILLVVGLSAVLDWYINEGNAMFLTAVLWFYISNEALSLLENLSYCGVPIPRRLARMLEDMGREEEDRKETKRPQTANSPS